VLRQAQHKCFGRLSNRASTSSAQVLRQAQQPCFDRLSNRASTGSATATATATGTFKGAEPVEAQSIHHIKFATKKFYY